MSKKTIDRDSACPYHVCNRSLDGLFYPVPMPVLWKRCLRMLQKIKLKYSVNIHAFVLMSNHYHLVIDCPLENLSAAMRLFQSEFSKFLRYLTESQRFRFAGRYSATLLCDIQAYSSVMAYVAQNPCLANMVDDFRSYRFSTFSKYFFYEEILSPEKTFGLDFRDTGKLCRRFETEQLEYLRKGLKKKVLRMEDVGSDVS